MTQGQIDKTRRAYNKQTRKQRRAHYKQQQGDVAVVGSQWTHRCLMSALVFMSLNNTDCGVCGYELVVT